MSKYTYRISYIKSLDGLRGVAVFFVLLFHGSYGFFQGGWIGVDLFFVLSGFLITSLLLNEYLNSGTISFSNFYARRLLRLTPPLILCLMLANILWSSTQFFDGANQKLATIGGLFYFTNLIKGNVSGNLSHLWSLSVEEHFYMFFPLLALFFVFKLSKKSRIVFVIIFFVCVSVLRIIVGNYQQFFLYDALIIDADRFTFCKIDGILLGVLLAFIITTDFANFLIGKLRASFLLIFLMSALIIILFTLSQSNVFWRNGGFVLTDLLCFFIILVAIKNPNNFLLSNNLLTWLGRRSYGIYVYHFPVFLFLENYREVHNIKNFLIVTFVRFFLSFLLAEISFRYFEKPLLKLKEKYVPVRN